MFYSPMRRLAANAVRCAVLAFISSMFALLAALPAAATETPKITVLYDAFGKDKGMEKDWGFAAYIEYGGKRILFDTGNNADVFEHNVRAKGIDLTKLDFAIISHRHGDHMGGLNYLLKINPAVKIYVPQENFGVFGAAFPGTFYRRDEKLPPEMRYFDGKPPKELKFGTPWSKANFTWIKETTELMPGMRLILLPGTWGVDLEVKEISLAFDTPDGPVVVVGCSHPTAEKIVESAEAAFGKPVHLLIGGLHLVTAKDEQIAATVAALHDRFHVEYVAPAHCTGEPAFEALQKSFGKNYVYAGAGSTVLLGPKITIKASAEDKVRYAMDADDYRDYRDARKAGPLRALFGKKKTSQH